MATIRLADRVDVYTRVTSHIVAELERGTRPWLKPWNAEHAAGRITRPLRHNGQAYQGINVLMLWASAEMAGYSCPFWMTFQQAKELGGFIKKGEHGSPVVYASKFTKKEAGGDEVERETPFLKEYTVFNAQQTEGLPQHFYQLAEPAKNDMQRIERAETFFANTKAEIRNGGNRAYYAMGSRLGPVSQFGQPPSEFQIDLRIADQVRRGVVKRVARSKRPRWVANPGSCGSIAQIAQAG